MQFVIDTHSLHWYLQDSSSLSSKAKRIIDKATLIFIPSVVLLEYLFVAKKKGLLNMFKKFLRSIPNEKFTVYPVELTLIKVCANLLQRKSLEIHDLTIVATAKHLGLPIITKDEEITKSYKKVIWK